MKSETLTVVLVFSCLFFVVADIVLALCLGLVLPKYVTHFNWYYAGGEKFPFREAAAQCGCLYKQFPNGTDQMINLTEIEKIVVTTEKITPNYDKDFPFIQVIVAEVNRGGKDVESEIMCIGVNSGESEVHLPKDCVLDVSKMSLGGRLYIWENRQGAHFSLIRPCHFFTHITVVKLQERWETGEMGRGFNIHFSGNITYAYVVGFEDVVVPTPLVVQVWTTEGMPENITDVCSTYSNKWSLLKLGVTICKEVFQHGGFSERSFCYKYRMKKYYGKIPEEAKKCG